MKLTGINSPNGIKTTGKKQGFIAFKITILLLLISVFNLSASVSSFENKRNLQKSNSVVINQTENPGDQPLPQAGQKKVSGKSRRPFLWPEDPVLRMETILC